MSKKKHKNVTPLHSLEELQMRMGGLRRGLDNARRHCRYVSVALVEHHLPKHSTPLSISLFGIAREVDALLGLCESRLLDALSMTEDSVDRELAAVSSDLEVAMRRAKERPHRRGVLDELYDQSRQEQSK